MNSIYLGESSSTIETKIRPLYLIGHFEIYSNSIAGLLTPCTAGNESLFSLDQTTTKKQIVNWQLYQLNIFKF